LKLGKVLEFENNMLAKAATN